MLVGCGQNSESVAPSTPEPPAPEAEPHIHAPAGHWICDFDNHWRICACGEEVDKGAHTLQDVNCTVCGSELILWEEGTRQITVYDDYGHCCQVTYYDTEGNVLNDERLEFVYDDNGKYTSMKAYNNGFCYSSYEYTPDADDRVYMATQTTNFEDGSYQIDTYDENFNTLRTLYHDAVENRENDHRFTYSEDGSRMTEQTYQVDTYDENFNTLRSVYYDVIEQAEIDHRYTYSEGGSRLSEQTYQDGVLTYEQDCRWNNEAGCWEMIAERAYGDDGSLAYTYDDSGNPLSEVHYSPDGSVDVEYTFENTYDLSGNLLYIRIFKNGSFTEQVERLYLRNPDI